MLLSRHQNVGQNWDIRIANRSFKNVSQLKYLGATVTNKNLTQEEIKRRLNSGNACYHLVRNLCLSSAVKKRKNQNTQDYNFACDSDIKGESQTESVCEQVAEERFWTEEG
jgi:hypothetical protein